ncbi:MAG: glycerol-3-phosphate 1-O-acyltransferase PlsY [Bacilli bacterium]|nr:glycerol-3-phosphate 1-O-acyltransferase PlsY [Bacilli bacterium]
MDIILYNILIGFCCLIFGYFFGSIPFAVLISKKFYHTDIRQEGSKNAGATNVGRVLGRKAGFLVFGLDVLKSIIPFWITWAILVFVPFGGNTLIGTVQEINNNCGNFWNFASAFDGHILKYPAYWLTFIGTCIGHCFPIFEKFKGGKGAATLFGLAAGTCWLITLPFLVLFLIIVKKTHKMSISVLISIGGAVICHWIFFILLATKVLPVWWDWFIGFGPTILFGLTSTCVITFNYILTVIRHKSNIIRLIHHEESTTNLF